MSSSSSRQVEAPDAPPSRSNLCAQVVGMMGHKDIADKCQHINFGLVLGMSTRKGSLTRTLQK